MYLFFSVQLKYLKINKILSKLLRQKHIHLGLVQLRIKERIASLALPVERKKN